MDPCLLSGSTTCNPCPRDSDKVLNTFRQLHALLVRVDFHASGTPIRERSATHAAGKADSGIAAFKKASLEFAKSGKEVWNALRIRTYSPFHLFPHVFRFGLAICNAAHPSFLGTSQVG